MRLPIRTRLTAWYVLLLALVLVAVGGFVVTRLRADLGSEIDRSLASAGPKIADGYKAEGRQDFVDVANTLFPALPAGPATAEVVDPRGRVLLAYDAAAFKSPLVSQSFVASAMRKPNVLSTISVDGQNVRVFTRPVVRSGQTNLVVVAKSLKNRDHSVSRLMLLLLIALPVALAAAALGGWLLARRALKPVERMTSQADHVSVDRLAERISVPAARDELAHLAETLNAMLGRLQSGVEEKRRLVADTSHELRTPLAAMRSELDVSLRYDDLPDAARSVLLSAREEVERMTELVANLLTLARIDEGRLELHAHEIDLGELVARVAENVEPLAAGAGVELEVDETPVTVNADEERLRQVVTNLVGNAIKFAGPGARVRIAGWRSDDEGGIVVTDTGPGIPREAQAQIFDRFWRAEESRGRDGGGSGLGLAICREIAEAHGGRIWVESEEGHGARFWVALPTERSPEPTLA